MENKALPVELYFDTRTAEQWTAVTKVIPKGFLCAETDGEKMRLKIGDGTHAYSELPYVSGAMDEDATKQLAQAEVAKLGTVFRLKGRVDGTDDLPSTGNQAGDVYLVGAENDADMKEYYWTGTLWDYMGTTTVDLSGYYTKTETDTLLAAKAGQSEVTSIAARVTSLESNAVKSTDKLILSCTLGE